MHFRESAPDNEPALGLSDPRREGEGGGVDAVPPRVKFLMTFRVSARGGEKRARLAASDCSPRGLDRSISSANGATIYAARVDHFRAERRR